MIDIDPRDNGLSFLYSVAVCAPLIYHSIRHKKAKSTSNEVVELASLQNGTPTQIGDLAKSVWPIGLDPEKKSIAYMRSSDQPFETSTIDLQQVKSAPKKFKKSPERSSQKVLKGNCGFRGID